MFEVGPQVHDIDMVHILRRWSYWPDLSGLKTIEDHTTHIERESINADNHICGRNTLPSRLKRHIIIFSLELIII